MREAKVAVEAGVGVFSSISAAEWLDWTVLGRASCPRTVAFGPTARPCIRPIGGLWGIDSVLSLGRVVSESWREAAA